MSDKERLERIKDIHERAIFEHGDGDRKFELRDIVYTLWQEHHADWLIEQAEKTQKLNELIVTHAPDGRNYTNAQYVELLHERQSLYEEVNRLREALAFYADEGNYVLWNGMAMSQKEIERDKGKKAKTALEGEG